MRKILGLVLLCLFGISSCRAVTIPAASPSTTHIASSQITLVSTPTSTVPPAKSTPTVLSSTASELKAESTAQTSSNTSIELTHAVEVYRRSYCGTCHTLTLAETLGTFGPNQDDAGLIAEQRIRDPDYTGSASSAADYLMESLVEPQAYIVTGYELSRHKMPPFTHLTEEDLQALVNLLLLQTHTKGNE